MNQDSVAQDVSPALSSEGSDERERLLGSESVKFQTSRDSENGDKGNIIHVFHVPNSGDVGILPVSTFSQNVFMSRLIPGKNSMDVAYA